MKKLVLVSATLFASILGAKAQEIKWGAKAGIDFATVKVKMNGGFWGETVEASESQTGFFVGGFAEISFAEKWAVQPEALYVSIKDASMLSVPVLAKYKVAEKFNLLAGPSLNYNLDWDDEKFKVNIDFGAAYTINENIGVSAKYSMGFGDIQLNGVFMAVEYKF